MIANIKHKLISFDKEEFLPVYREGQLDNLDQFIAYKAGKVANRVVDQLDQLYYSFGGR